MMEGDIFYDIFRKRECVARVSGCQAACYNRMGGERIPYEHILLRVHREKEQAVALVSR